METFEAAPRRQEFQSQLAANMHHFEGLLQACGGHFNKGCGSYYFDGQTYAYCQAMQDKQQLLWQMAQTATSLLETGVYMGHSLLFCLMANPKLRVTAVDRSDHY